MRRFLIIISILLLLALMLPVPGDAQSGRVRRPQPKKEQPTETQSSTAPATNTQSSSSTTENSATAPKRPSLKTDTPTTTGGRSRSGNKPSASTSETERPSAETSADTPGPVVEGGADDEGIKLDATLVTLPVVVSDRSGYYVAKLTKKDFALYEDRVRQEIAFFTSEQVPFHVALLIDKSGSTTESEFDIKSAALSFIRELNRDDKVMVVSFGSDVTVENEFTNDRARLTRAVEDIRWGGSTRLYDAVYNTVTQRLNQVEGRKAIVLLSDGQDTSSREAKRQEALDAAIESGALVYVVRYPSDAMNQQQQPGRVPFPIPMPGPYPPNGRDRWPQPQDRWPNPRDRRDPDNRRRPRNRRPWPFMIQQWAPLPQGPQPRTDRTMRQDDFLGELVEESGGDIFLADRYTDLNGFLHTIAEELRHVYVIGFYPANTKADGRFRRLEVVVTTQPNLAVRHKRGYQAPTQQFAASSVKD